MSVLVLDIETVGTEDESVIAEIAKGVTPPKNYTKADTIAKWEAEDKPTLVADAVAKTSFDGGLGRIICIGFASSDNEVNTLSGIERDMLKDFFSLTTTFLADTVVGHNVTWDLRFLYQRSVVHGLRPPPMLLKAMKAKPWDSILADTMLLWNPERDKKISLDKLCRILGIETPKGDITGATVGQAYKDGRLDEIAEYCKGDVIATRECYRRLTWTS